MSSWSTTLTADRGYVHLAFVLIPQRFGFSALFIMPSNLLHVHPSVGASHLPVERAEKVMNPLLEQEDCVSDAGNTDVL